uniref:Receptor kinase-like protein Xa21 n=1 Tax=Oryza meridionalis TaxID=40149 RepID=A0A0E0E8Y2_9ORYZ
MDLHMQSCPQVSHRMERKINLARLLIPIFGFMSLIILICIILHVASCYINRNVAVSYVGCFKKILHAEKTSRQTYILLLSFGKQFPRVSYKDLARATGNFSESNLIGRGSYGSVCRAKLTQAKIQVAIKVFDLEERDADKSFVSECETLRSIRHRNLLHILTVCSTIDSSGNAFKALIYEYMPNGNLDMWLYKKFASVASKCLNFAQRVSIAVDIANALSYLHNECERSIVHCDLKPTNILLDDDMNAYLGDFSISSLSLDPKFASPEHFSPNSSIRLTGTIGYIAPEYAQCAHPSTYGDVYSFGIVLLEMLTGKRPTDPMFENELNIVNFVEKNFPEQIPQIIEARLQEECKGFNQERIGRSGKKIGFINACCL